MINERKRLISETAHKVLTDKKYFKNGESEWENIADRVSKAIANGEPTTELKETVGAEINTALKNLDFIFSSPCLLNADINNPGQLSSCFVLGVKDDIESICLTDAHFSKIFQRNGGAGTDLSVLRPNKSKVENTNGYSCGVLGFMDKFNGTADVMTRNNPTKRGALKINLSIWHPDIEEFICSKENTNTLQLMNISVSLFDDFMQACIDDKDWNLIFPDHSWNKEIYDREWNGNIYAWQEKGYPVVVYKTMKARELLNLLITQMWKTGEPGVNFQSTMNRDNMNPHLGDQVFTNPCNEFVNLIYTSCNLGSINLVRLVKDGKIDNDLLKYMVFKGVRWLDDMITVNKLPLPEIQAMTEKIRPIGLGVMGFADLLYLLKLPYNSQAAFDFADDLFGNIKKYAIEASMVLAEERGVYPGWVGSVWEQKGIKIRHSNLLSLAPTGTISIIGGVSGSIEPNFGLVFYRTSASGQKYLFVNEIFESELKRLGIYSEELLLKIFNNHGSCKGIDEIPQFLQDIFVTAHDVTPIQHVDMLITIQKHIDLAISKTINFNNDASKDFIEQIIFKAWAGNVKGLTIYRDGCRENQTLSTGSTYTQPQEPKVENKVKTRKEMGRRLQGSTYMGESACGKFYITLNHDENNNIVESFVNFKTGLCKANIDGLNRLISYALRKGLPVEEVAEQIQGITCSACTRVKSKGEREIDGISCPDIISKLISEEAKTISTLDKPAATTIVESPIPELKTNKTKLDYITALQQGVCPECGAKIEHESGCVECKECGWSKC